MTIAFKDYFDYMKNTQYIDDGNQILYEKHFVDKGHPENNENPLYVIDYDNKYGNKKTDYDDEMLSHNDISEINMTRSKNMVLDNLQLITIDENTIEIQNKDKSIKRNEIQSLIIRLLQDGKTVIYNPVSEDGYDAKYYDFLIANKNTLYKSLEFVFVPEIKGSGSQSFQDFFKPSIQPNQAMLFRPEKILIDLLLMVINLNLLSEYVNAGTYEFISRLRVGYIVIKKPRTSALTDTTTSQLGGEGDDLETKFIDNYMEGLEIMYGTAQSGVQSGVQSGGKKRKNKKVYKTKRRNKGTMKKRKSTKKRKTKT
jgi:hypothetical protein